jgi:exosortase/archaeosortase family protein
MLILKKITATIRTGHVRYAGVFSGVGAFGIAGLFLACFPTLKIDFFGQAASRLASLFLGTPVLRVDEGWLLPSSHESVVVSAACSGTDFWLMCVLVLGWQLGRGRNQIIKAIALTLFCATAFSFIVNAIRVMVVTQAHRWLIPLWPENYAAFFHQSAGVAVFLPALIFLHAILENQRFQHSQRTP